MDFNVTITLRLESALQNLIERKVPDVKAPGVIKINGQTLRSEMAAAEFLGQSAAASALAPTPAKEEAVPEAAPAPAIEPNPEPIDPPAEEPKQTPAPAPAKDLKAIVREIIHKTRQRFEGENYLENPTSKEYQKYHKQVGNVLKQIAVTLGYEKPTAIDTPEMVDAFRARAEELEINGNGDIAAPKAPY